MLVVLTAVLTACEGEQGPAGRDGVTTSWDVQYFVVGEISSEYTSDRWEPLGNGRYQCVFNVPKLTNFIYNEGIVQVSYMQDMDMPNEIQIGLPHILFKYDPIKRSEYTLTYTFDTTPSSIAFNAAYSDFEDAVPPVCTFKVTMLW